MRLTKTENQAYIQTYFIFSREEILVFNTMRGNEKFASMGYINCRFYQAVLIAYRFVKLLLD